MKTLFCNIGSAAGLAACLAASPATPAFAKTVVMDAGSSALTAGSSFAWAATSTAMVDPASTGLANEITGQRLQASIVNALSGHGYRQRAAASEADLVVSYHVAVGRKQDVRVNDTSYRACGPRRCWTGWTGSPSVSTYEYTQGTLVIDLVDRRSGRLVWRATSEKRVDADDLTQAKLDSIVARMMKSLPTA